MVDDGLHVIGDYLKSLNLQIEVEVGEATKHDKVEGISINGGLGISIPGIKRKGCRIIIKEGHLLIMWVEVTPIETNLGEKNEDVEVRITEFPEKNLQLRSHRIMLHRPDSLKELVQVIEEILDDEYTV
jgi:hypothetical protein